MRAITVAEYGASPVFREIRLEEVPAAFKTIGHGDGKTMIAMGPDR